MKKNKLTLKKWELIELSKEIIWLSQEKIPFLTRLELSKNRDSIEGISDDISEHINQLQIPDEKNPDIVSKESAKAIGEFSKEGITVDYFPLKLEDIGDISDEKPYLFIFKLFG